MFNVPKTFTWDNGMDREIMGGLQQFAQLGMAAIIMDGLGTPGRGKEFHDLSFPGVISPLGSFDPVAPPPGSFHL